jgi:hypothetical protein
MLQRTAFSVTAALRYVAAHCQWLANKHQEVKTTHVPPASRRKMIAAVVRQRPNREQTCGRTSMDVRLEQQKLSDTSLAHKASNELIKLIRKLRWVGMDEEARGLQKELTRREAAGDSVLATPAETD